ncbi:T9SS type A sorting domain-containing protein [Desulfosarcina sp.]|nr:T9SS type A sorting domain-containing protein [Desulfosarcina sp.]
MNDIGESGYDYSIHAIVMDQTNGYILGGHHTDSTEMNLLNPMMAGFNLDGALNWTQVQEWEGRCEVTDIFLAHNEGCIAAISTINSEPSQLYLMKTDFNGNEEFKKPVFFGPEYHAPFWILGTKSSIEGYVFTSDISLIQGQSSLVIFKTNEVLDTLWTKTYFDYQVGYPYDIIQTSDNNYVILCKGYNESNSSSDACLLKIDDSGEVLWQKYFGGDGTDRPKHLFEDESGNLVFCGSTSSYSDNMQAWVVKVDEEGNELWNEVLEEDQDSNAQHIIEYAPSKYIATGYHDVDNSASVKTHASVMILDKSPTSINNTIEVNLSIGLFPNPMTEKCTINYKLDKDAFVKIDLMNSQGYIIKNILSNKQQAGKQGIVFLNEGLDAGAYFLRFSINNDISMRKLMIMN